MPLFFFLGFQISGSLVISAKRNPMPLSALMATWLQRSCPRERHMTPRPIGSVLAVCCTNFSKATVLFDSTKPRTSMKLIE